MMLKGCDKCYISIQRLHFFITSLFSISLSPTVLKGCMSVHEIFFLKKLKDSLSLF